MHLDLTFCPYQDKKFDTLWQIKSLELKLAWCESGYTIQYNFIEKKN